MSYDDPLFTRRSSERLHVAICESEDALHVGVFRFGGLLRAPLMIDILATLDRLDDDIESPRSLRTLERIQRL